MGQVLDLRGQKYGRLTVVRFMEIRHHKAIWKCRCECGGMAESASTDLRSGNTKSCGCLNVEVREARCFTHRMSKALEYKSWGGMIQRCTNPKNPRWDSYGGRGIRVCDRWMNSFEAFFQDMGRKPARGWSIERVDNSGDYEPGNCRWATQPEQNRNTRQNVLLTHGGETLCQNDWAERLGVTPWAIGYHLKNGRSFDWVVEHLRARQAA